MSGKYDHLEEPTFGTILLGDDPRESNQGRYRTLYIFAPQEGDEGRHWTTSYREKHIRYISADVWHRAKDPDDHCVIIYDPRVDYIEEV